MSRPGGGVAASHDVRATLQEMWDTRPARRSDERKVAGVAAAIARRYAVDPTLVRIAIVVAAFYGVGILLYAAAWLALPPAASEGAPQPARAGSARGRAIAAAVIVGVIALGTLAGGQPRIAVGVLVVGALLYALHRSRATAAATAVTSAGPATGAAGTPSAGADAGGPAPADGTVEGRRPPDWDPMGAAPFAWDLPEPGPPPGSGPRRSVLTPVTLALAFLAAAAVAVLDILGLVPIWGTVAVLATALAVIGVGLVIGAFRHTGRGLIVAAVPLVLVLVAAASGAGDRRADRGDWQFGGPPFAQGVADATWTPTGAVAPVYETGVGDGRLDLRSVPPGTPVDTTVRSGAGDVTVLVPRNADVRVTCSTGVGDIDCLGQASGDVVDPGPDGPGGPVMTIRATSGVGDVEVDRG